MLLQKYTKMKLLFMVSIFLIMMQQCVAPPVAHNKDEEKQNEVEEDDEANIFEYQRYLKEVVEMLESDTAFRERLQNADEADIRSGKIADKLDLVNRHIRSKLDEIKRRELERLRHLATKEFELTNNLNIDAEHVDHENPHTFEINDLKKLIAKTTQDLAEADKRRRAEFKEYEMQKQFEEEQKMQGNTGLSDEDRKKYIEEQQKLREQHKKHEPVHHPGSRQQLEEVWEKQDHMENAEFKPKDFFFMHDVDGNGVWDPDEVKSLFLQDLNKIYQPGSPGIDPYERNEELERMREHLFKEADLDRNGLIDFSEFLERTKDANFQQDEGWQTIDEQQNYSPEEYVAYKTRHQQEMQQDKLHPQQVQYNPHQQQLHQVPPIQGQIPQQHQQQYQQVPPQYNPPSDYHYQGNVKQQPGHLNQEVPHQPHIQYQQQNYQPPEQNVHHQQFGNHQQAPQHQQPAQAQQPVNNVNNNNNKVDNNQGQSAQNQASPHQRPLQQVDQNVVSQVNKV